MFACSEHRDDRHDYGTLPGVPNVRALAIFDTCYPVSSGESARQPSTLKAAKAMHA